MFGRSSEDVAKFLSEISGHQNLITLVLFVAAIALGAGLWIGQAWGEGKLAKPLTPASQKYLAKQSTSPAKPAVKAVSTVPITKTLSNLVNINLASIPELDALPGIGPVYAQKIITSRPYGSSYDLVSRKVLPLSTYNKIKGLISVQ